MGLPIRGVNLIVVVSVFWALAVAGVVMRISSRIIKGQRLVFNDWAIFLALLFATGNAIANIIGVAMGGVGAHIQFTTSEQQMVSIPIYVFVWQLQAIGNTFARLSFLDLLRRIFQIRLFQIATWVVFTACVLYGLAVFISFFAICQPIQYQWDPSIQNGHCGNGDQLFLVSAIFNLILDFIIIMLPLPVVWSLQMKTGRKIALTAIFTVGLVVCVITVLRTVAVINFATLAAKMDFTYTVFYDALWSSLEASLGVFNACMPLFPAVMKSVVNSRIVSRIRSSLANSRLLSLHSVDRKGSDPSSYSSECMHVQEKPSAAHKYRIFDIAVTQDVEVVRDDSRSNRDRDVERAFGSNF